MSLQAYQTTATRTESPRETEYRLLGFVTSELIRIQSEGRSNLSAFAEAIDRNRRMWSIFSTDCVTDGNGLPNELRAQIVSIAAWVSRYSSEVIQDGADVTPLIDVNKNVMQGLSPG